MAARGTHEGIATWVDSFRLHAEFDERFIYYPASRTVQHRPVATSTTMTADAALATLSGGPLAWLREQLG
ncbi:hypothetical protein [Frankia sp. AgB32]|uniref:hypothetical protein n=1 Tax=Frankia sp. AgB32 TaxID=631119 RepID=UPI00200F84E3|nr:hypothetical protein [Frankia sp. AgB32]MCK9897799.1 hypothetical protein [Frankia sp. AgB32]